MRLQRESGLVAALAPELAEMDIILSKRERHLLEQALVICNKGWELEELRAKLQSEGGDLDEAESSYGWSAIHLGYILGRRD